MKDMKFDLTWKVRYIPPMEEIQTSFSVQACIARDLKRARERAGLTLKQLSQRSGFSVSYISKVENGGSKSLGVEVIITLCRSLQTPLLEILQYAEKTHLCELESSEHSDDEFLLLKRFRLSNDRQKKAILEMVSAMSIQS